MYLGDFLVQKNIINNDQLIDALSVQLDSMPSFLTILKENSSIPSSVLLDAIRKQVIEQRSLIDIIQKDGILDNDKINDLLDEQNKKRPSLGQVLIEKNYTTKDQFESALNEFEALPHEEEAVASQTPQPVQEKPQQESVSNSEEESVSDAAMDSLRDLIESGVIDASALDEFKAQNEAPTPKVEDTEHSTSEVEETHVNLADEAKIEASICQNELDTGFVENLSDTFSESLYAQLKENVKEFIETKNIGPLERMYNSLHMIKGCAQLAGSSAMVKFITHVEDDILKYQRDPDYISHLEEKARLYGECIVLIFQLRNHILASGDEKGFFTEGHCQKYNSCISKLI